MNHQENEKAVVLFGPAVEALSDEDLRWLREQIAGRTGGLAVHMQLSELKLPAITPDASEEGSELDADVVEADEHPDTAKRLGESGLSAAMQSCFQELITSPGSLLTSSLAESWHTLVQSPENFVRTLHLLGCTLTVADNAGYRVKLLGVKREQHQSAAHYELRTAQLILLGRQYEVAMWNEEHFGSVPPPDMPSRQWDEDTFDAMTLPELFRWADDLNYKLEIHPQGD